MIPGGLGVQEGGYLMVGNMLGIPPEASLALSLSRRARELAFGVPALLVWPALEGRYHWRKAAASAAAVASGSK